MRTILLFSLLVFTSGCGLDCAIWGTFACGDGSKGEPAIDEIEPNDTEVAATDVGMEDATIEGVCEADEEFDFFVRRQAPPGNVYADLFEENGLRIRMYHELGTFDLEAEPVDPAICGLVTTAGDVFFVVLCTQTTAVDVSYYADVF